MPQAFSAVGKYAHATDVERIGDLIKRHGKVGVDEIFRKNYYTGGYEEVRRMIAMVTSMGLAKLSLEGGKEILTAINIESPWGNRRKANG